jgi:hypothetical protein
MKYSFFREDGARGGLTSQANGTAHQFNSEDRSRGGKVKAANIHKRKEEIVKEKVRSGILDLSDEKLSNIEKYNLISSFDRFEGEFPVLIKFSLNGEIAEYIADSPNVFSAFLIGYQAALNSPLSPNANKKKIFERINEE